jgi:class 3 adenylate cyclase
MKVTVRLGRFADVKVGSHWSLLMIGGALAALAFLACALALSHAVVARREGSPTGFTSERQPRARADRILTTVLFTDIVASTECVAAVGDRRWRAILDAHDEAVRNELTRFGGKEIKTTGDGFLASFDGPARAIRCAQAITSTTGNLGIELRAGLHTGECEVRGADLAGLAVHIAARVGALAGPQEVLVSSTVKDLVAGSGIAFCERGEYELKGVPGLRRLFAAEA